MERCKHGLVKEHCALCTSRRVETVKKCSVPILNKETGETWWLHREVKRVEFRR